jgi:hypothetical protein
MTRTERGWAMCPSGMMDNSGPGRCGNTSRGLTPILTTPGVKAMNEPTEKRCPKCGEVKPIDQFQRSAGRYDGRQSWCKICSNQRDRARYAADPSKSAQWYRRRKAADPEKINAPMRARYAEIRDQVFDHYGRVCSCPGCGATSSLTVDHVNGDGRQHRAELSPSTSHSGHSNVLYRWLVKNGFPAGFQTLCRPCNASKDDGSVCQLDHANPARRTTRQRRGRPA